MPIQTITTTTYTKPNSGTSVQKTLKEEVTTYFTKIAIGSNGTGSIDISDGQSKGALAVLGPQNFGGGGSYLVVYPAQQNWLGSVSADVRLPVGQDAGAGKAYVTQCTAVGSVDLTSIQPNGINIVGIGSQPVGIIKVDVYHLSGSTEPDVEAPPSGSQLYITAHGTKSPVF